MEVLHQGGAPSWRCSTKEVFYKTCLLEIRSTWRFSINLVLYQGDFSVMEVVCQRHFCHVWRLIPSWCSRPTKKTFYIMGVFEGSILPFIRVVFCQEYVLSVAPNILTRHQVHLNPPMFTAECFKKRLNFFYLLFNFHLF